MCIRDSLHAGDGPVDDTGVVAAGDLDGDIFPIHKIHSGLGFCDGGSGLESRGENKRHTAGDAAQYAAMAIGLGADLPIVHIKWVVIFAAPEEGNYSGTLSSSFKIQLGKVKGLKNGTLKTDSVQIKCLGVEADSCGKDAEN